MSPLLIVYLLVGPIFWSLTWIGVWLSRSRMDKLRGYSKPLEGPPPQVVICIPAKDEGPDVAKAIHSALSQTYPNFRVIAVDDRSRDETGTVLDQLAAADNRLSVFHIPNDGLPEGWLGKCHALHAATRGLSAEWILFVDSDVTLAPTALADALAIASNRKYDALSILTTLECRNRLERIMLPLLAGTWAVLYFVSLTNIDSRVNRAEANGQFFLVRRSAYEAVGGHETVRAMITEDVELMRLLKSNEFKVRLFMAPHLAATRMHATLSQMFHGWSRIYSGTSRRSPWRILTGMLTIALSIFTVYPALVIGLIALWSGHPQTLAAALVHLLLMTWFLRMIYRESGNPAWPALVAPFSCALLFAIFAYTLRKCYTGQIIWRDTLFKQS